MPIVIATVLAIAAALVLEPFAPRFSGHTFVDARTIAGIPNFMDVVSNVAFIAVGVLGLATLAPPGRATFVDQRERWPWIVFFAGVVLVGLGSGYYHLAPDRDRLLWDRLPITIAFMAFFAAVIAERVRVGLGLIALALLVPLGALSAVYWHRTGDLRPYMLVQLWPILVVPVLVIGWPARYTRGRDVLIVVAAYALAKVAEVLDRQIFAAGGVISGHSLKHLIAGVALVVIVSMLRRREPLPAAL